MRKKRTREYFGAHIAESLCEWLNDSDFVEEHPDLIQLIDLAARYHMLRRDDSELRQELTRSANDVFAKYKFEPLVNDVYEEWEVDWIPREQPEAGEVVYDFLRLGQMGVLPHLRRCGYKKCSRWFFAKPTQSFHSTKCRDAEAKANPARRKKRQAYDRRYYRENLSKHAGMESADRKGKR